MMCKKCTQILIYQKILFNCHSERSEESLANASSKVSRINLEILRRFTPQDDKKEL